MLAALLTHQNNVFQIKLIICVFYYQARRICAYQTIMMIPAILFKIVPSVLLINQINFVQISIKPFVILINLRTHVIRLPAQNVLPIKYKMNVYYKLTIFAWQIIWIIYVDQKPIISASWITIPFSVPQIQVFA